MKTIGLIGGMSWESTIPYYRDINQLVKRRLGGLHSARVIIYSIDFHEIERFQRAGQWEEAGAHMAEAACALEAAGADCVLVCANTMHKLAPAIEAAVKIPLLHIADPAAEAVRKAGLRTVGLLGTRFTMEEDFIRGRLETRQDIRVIVPAEEDRSTVHRVIYEELCLGIVRDESRDAYRAIIGRLVAAGAEGIILGCTEIAMLISPADSPVPVFDTTGLHAASAVDFALGT